MHTDVLTHQTPHYSPSPAARFKPKRARRPFGLSILVIDDDPADTSLILSALKRHPDVSSACATDAPLFALRQLAAGRLNPDLVLLDIHMPKMDGFGFLKELREIPAMAEAAVAFLTTSRRRKDVGDARESSASVYIVKPDTFGELQARLNGLVRRTVRGAWVD